MKKVLLALIVAGLALSAATLLSCGNNTDNTGDITENVDSIKSIMLDLNAKLPISVDGGGVLDSVYYDGGSKKAVFNYVVGYDVDMDVLVANNSSAKKMVLDMIGGNDSIKSIYKMVADNGIDTRTMIMSTRTAKNSTIDLSAEELKQITAASAKDNDSIPRDSLSHAERLKVCVDSINALCPDSIDRRTELTRVQVENNYLVYNYVKDEGGNNETVDRLKRQLSGWKASAESKMRKPSPEMLTLMKTCVDNGLGIKHRYVGNETKQTISFSFDAVALSKICDQPLPEGYEAIKERTKPITEL